MVVKISEIYRPKVSDPNLTRFFDELVTALKEVKEQVVENTTIINNSLSAIPAWTNATLGANVGNYTIGGRAGPRYYKDPNTGLVKLVGSVITLAALAVGAPLVVMPAGTRYGYSITLPTVSGVRGGYAFSAVELDTTGVVLAGGVGAGFITHFDLTWRAEL